MSYLDTVSVDDSPREWAESCARVCSLCEGYMEGEPGGTHEECREALARIEARERRERRLRHGQRPGRWSSR